MPKIADACSHVRSKKADPFCITLDVWFPDRAAFERYAGAPALQAASIAALYGVEPALVKHFAIADLLFVEISYPRPRPQGGACERDMHGGQQYVRLLDVEQ